MKDHFYKLSDSLFSHLNSQETALLNLEAEETDFIRFNNAQVKQATHVKQQYLNIKLIHGQKHINESISLTGHEKEDLTNLLDTLNQLRSFISTIKEDPYLSYSKEIQNSEQHAQNNLPQTENIIQQIISSSKNYDLVGILAKGDIYRGFSNSLGQRNWYHNKNFNFDYSIYSHGDKASKSSYAGFDWSESSLQNTINRSIADLDILKMPSKTLSPGEYNIYLAPSALEEIAGILSWGSFSTRSHKSKTSSLFKMMEDGKKLHSSFSISENTEKGTSPPFTTDGYIKPQVTPLISNGIYQNTLVSPRSSIEYQLPVNTDQETPCSLTISPGQLEEKDILKKLGTGIYANQLWYLNYSDVQNCRITGMTRFASFWVENGEIVAPLNVMRFDESIYRAFGENLVDLTKSQTFIPSSSSDKQRSTDSMLLPGALISNYKFTL